MQRATCHTTSLAMRSTRWLRRKCFPLLMYSYFYPSGRTGLRIHISCTLSLSSPLLRLLVNRAAKTLNGASGEKSLEYICIWTFPMLFSTVHGSLAILEGNKPPNSVDDDSPLRSFKTLENEK